jgi:hypothetical protein
MTPQQLITEAMAAIQEISPRQTPSRSELAHGLSVLNGILSSWSVQHRKVYSIDNLRFPLTDGKSKYTMGPNGDFESFRPVKIESANVLRYDDGTVGIATPLELVPSKEEWSAIPEKGMRSLQPLKLYNDNQYPRVNLHLWPIPVCS